MFSDEYSSQREEEISFVMLHFSSNVVANPTNPYDAQKVIDTFLNYGVSAHYLIDRDGTVYHLVDESTATWHAGKGTWDNNEKYTDRMNHYSIGIEILGIGSYEDMSQYLTKEQYNLIKKRTLAIRTSSMKVFLIYLKILMISMKIFRLIANIL